MEQNIATQPITVDGAETRRRVAAAGFELSEVEPGWWAFVVLAVSGSGKRWPVSEMFESEAAALLAFDSVVFQLQRRRDQLTDRYSDLLQSGYRIDLAPDGFRIGSDRYDAESPLFATEIELLKNAIAVYASELTRIADWRGQATLYGFEVLKHDGGWFISTGRDPLRDKLLHGLPVHQQPYQSQEDALQHFGSQKIDLCSRRDHLFKQFALLCAARLPPAACEGGFECGTGEVFPTLVALLDAPSTSSAVIASARSVSALMRPTCPKSAASSI